MACLHPAQVAPNSYYGLDSKQLEKLCNKKNIDNIPPDPSLRYLVDIYTVLLPNTNSMLAELR